MRAVTVEFCDVLVITAGKVWLVMVSVTNVPGEGFFISVSHTEVSELNLDHSAQNCAHFSGAGIGQRPDWMSHCISHCMLFIGLIIVK